MFLGHFGVGLASKRFTRRAPLSVLLVAALLSDILGALFSLLGWEHVRIAPGITRFIPLDLYDYPWSHSLLMTVAWGALLAVIYGSLTSDLLGAFVISLNAASHWVLDWITHRPDLPLSPGTAERYGLGLWNSIPGTMAVEIGLFGAGVWIYARGTVPRDRLGIYMFITFSATLLLLYLRIPFSSPPNSMRQMDISSITSTIVFIAWASWFDCHRRTKE
jgi:hypothetical protein